MYRAHNPQWAWDPLSGEGARRRGGRFNRRGIPALYVSLTWSVAVGEASRIGIPLQPVLLCCYEVDSEPVFDATDVEALAVIGSTPEDLDSRWRRDRREGRVSASQALADRLLCGGYAGMLAPSFRVGASPEDRNLVLWSWSDALPSRVRLLDDEGRLAARRNSD